MVAFEPASAKLTIGSLDDTSLTVQASYNPKELGLGKSLSWKDRNEGDAKVLKGKQGSKSDQDSVELTGQPTRTMTIEMLFDGYEKGLSIEKSVQVLDELSSSRVPIARNETKRRPHYCVVTWGQKGIPAFRCVIEKLDIKYQMFDREGTPLRATCTVSLKEAEIKIDGSIDAAEASVHRKSRYTGNRAITVIGSDGNKS